MVEPMRGGEGNKGATFYAREVNRRGESTRLCGIRTRLCARWWRETERGGEREREPTLWYTRDACMLASARHLRALTDIQRSGAQRCSTRRVFKTGCWNAANGWTDTREGTCVTENPSRWRSRCHVALSEAAQSVPLYYPSREPWKQWASCLMGCYGSVNIPFSYPIFSSRLVSSPGEQEESSCARSALGSDRLERLKYTLFSSRSMLRRKGWLEGFCVGRKKIERKEDSFGNSFFFPPFCRFPSVASVNISLVEFTYTYTYLPRAKEYIILPLASFFHAQQIFAHILFHLQEYLLSNNL